MQHKIQQAFINYNKLAIHLIIILTIHNLNNIKYKYLVLIVERTGLNKLEIKQERHLIFLFNQQYSTELVK